MKELILVKKISKKFGSNIALNKIDFRIEAGQIFGFLGPSGAGKTTTIKILTGQLSYDEGEAVVLGKNIAQLGKQELENMGIVSDQSGYYEKLSLEKNLELYARLFNVEMKKIYNLLETVGLYKARKTMVEKLSNGMKQRMLLVRALINKPKLLFLDEPTSGLDPTTSLKIHELLFKLKKEGVAIFLTTHDMDEATKLCNQLILLFEGNIVEKGTPQEILKKHNDTHNVKVMFTNNSFKVFPMIDLKNFEWDKNKHSITSIHSLEPTLEEVFIKLTGMRLNEQ